MMMIFIYAMMTTTVALSETSNFPIAKASCDDTCGNTSIPFPFGTTIDCYQHGSFWVTCNHTFDPPKLFMQSSTIEITDISLDGQLRALQFVARDCYALDGTNLFRNSPSIWLTQYLTFNNTANMFTTVGCNTIGTVSGFRRSREYSMGCTALCEPNDDLVEGSCTGIGCCQTSITEDVSQVDISLRRASNGSDGNPNFNNCGYAFVVDRAAFNFSKHDLTSLKDVEYLPMVVDWAFGDGPCEEAQKYSTTYGCKSPNSECYKPGNSDVYRCRCGHGYQGNPYLLDGCREIDECTNAARNECMKIASCQNTAGDYTCICPKGYTGSGRGTNGCQDIDECADAAQNDCMKIARCNNTVGDYICFCPKGYSGNGRGTNGCTKDMKIANILIVIAFGIVALLLSAFLLQMELKRRRSRRMKQKFFLQNGGILLQEKLIRRQRSPDMVQIFSSYELQKATNDFDSSMIIGQGGFGTVYKGSLPHNTSVAIKKSKIVDPDQVEQFINEVLVLSQVNHRNVVRLIGCCLETEVPLLVYEFINNGTLSTHIHNQAKARFFHWDMRLKIAAETAGVLAYLHSAASTPIIHRDVKPDNILLDHTFTAKVSDFGASKLVPLDLTQLSTIVLGTIGYLDPEYMQTNQLTEKSDVYSFGVVLLELLTGRRAMSFDKPEQEKNLANFFLYVLNQERFFEIIDDNIVGEGNTEQILEVAKLAKGCLNVRGEDRPSMKEVAAELEGLRLGGKHAWGKNSSNADEMESLLDKVVELDVFTNGEGNSTSVGYESIRNHVLLPISGGR